MGTKKTQMWKILGDFFKKERGLLFRREQALDKRLLDGQYRLFFIYCLERGSRLPNKYTVKILQAFQNSDKHFFVVRENEKQYLVLITDEFMEIRRLTKMIENLKNGQQFELGGFQFTYSVELQIRIEQNRGTALVV